MRKKSKEFNKNEEFRVSRTDLALFNDCPRCYYNKVFSGISRPKSLPFVINNAIDYALKDEFDYFRGMQEAHPDFLSSGLQKLVPYNGDEFSKYRSKGIEFHDKLTNLVLFGKLDDVWEDTESGELFIADYKATSKKDISDIHSSFKMQMDIYVFIAQQVDDRFQNLTFFYYKNFKRRRSMVESDFETSIIHYETNTDWVRKSLIGLKELLHDGFAPEPSTECQYCNYAKQISNVRYLKKEEVMNV